MQHDADERGSGCPAGPAEFLCDRVALCRVESSQRLARKPRQMSERPLHDFSIAPERLQNIGLDRGVVSTWHLIFIARRNDHRGNGLQIVTLGLVELGHHFPQSKRLARRCFIWSAM